LPVEHKTIKPAKLGGLAGGEKYIGTFVQQRSVQTVHCYYCRLPIACSNVGIRGNGDGGDVDDNMQSHAIVHNLLFKFAVDSEGILGSDYAAAKVAGNELKGLISYFNSGVRELRVPLMALVDYMGMRDRLPTAALLCFMHRYMRVSLVLSESSIDLTGYWLCGIVSIGFRLVAMSVCCNHQC
jgi:hypothetical protein